MIARDARAVGGSLAQREEGKGKRDRADESYGIRSQLRAAGPARLVGRGREREVAGPGVFSRFLKKVFLFFLNIEQKERNKQTKNKCI